MKIEYTDDLPIHREETRRCYELMLKLSDLWFTFEHLLKVVKELFPWDAPSASKSNPFSAETRQRIGFTSISQQTTHTLRHHVFNEPRNRQEIYLLLSYLANNTYGSTRRIVEEIRVIIKSGDPFEACHYFSMIYALRNIYSHQGVAAALGGRDYTLKCRLYSILYDALVLYSLALGDAYCREKVKSYR